MVTGLTRSLPCGINPTYVFGGLRLEGTVVHDALVDRDARRERDAFGHCDTLHLVSEDL